MEYGGVLDYVWECGEWSVLLIYNSGETRVIKNKSRGLNVNNILDA